MKQALGKSKIDPAIPFPANNNTVHGVVEALKSVCLLENIEVGTRLDKVEVPSTLIFAQNGVYDWQNDVMYEHHPHWFNLSCLNADIEDDVPKPKRWLRFLNDLWEDDQASKDLLHEFMGLTLTVDTSFHKILLLIGPPRGGKGTINRILMAIHGQENVASPSPPSSSMTLYCP